MGECEIDSDEGESGAEEDDTAEMRRSGGSGEIIIFGGSAVGRDVVGAPWCSVRALEPPAPASVCAEMESSAA